MTKKIQKKLGLACIIAFSSILLLAVSAPVLTACSSIDCNIEGKVMCHYAIQDHNGTAVMLAYPLTVTFHRTAIEGDSVYMNMMPNVAVFDLPMSYTGDVDNVILTLSIPETEIVADTMEVETFRYLSDTISIAKADSPLFESVDCAPRYNHVLQGVSYTRHFIDTLIINQEVVSKDATTPNILIHIRPDSN